MHMPHCKLRYKPVFLFIACNCAYTAQPAFWDCGKIVQTSAACMLCSSLVYCCATGDVTAFRLRRYVYVGTKANCGNHSDVSLVQFPKGDSESAGKELNAVFGADGNVAVIL